MKTTSLHLYCTAHASEMQLDLAIIAAIRCNGKNSLFKGGKRYCLCFPGDFSVNRTTTQIVQSLGVSRETWQVCI